MASKQAQHNKILCMLGHFERKSITWDINLTQWFSSLGISPDHMASYGRVVSCRVQTLVLCLHGVTSRSSMSHLRCLTKNLARLVWSGPTRARRNQWLFYVLHLKMCMLYLLLVVPICGGTLNKSKYLIPECKPKVGPSTWHWTSKDLIWHVDCSIRIKMLHLAPIPKTDKMFTSTTTSKKFVLALKTLENNCRF